MSEVAMESAEASYQDSIHQEAIKQVVEGKSPIDATLLRLSDWMNPILVKETRQALKSRQFIATFALTLMAVLFWTILSIGLSVPGIYYLPGGPTLLVGYFIILMIPVCVVVPMSAFRSMASELEDGTHDILSLSTLSARQVVLGKLSVALLQSMIYFSAIIPCIALTYLLRGVGVGVLFLTVVGTIGFSVIFSTIAILFSTVGRTRDTQVLMTVILFLVLGPISCYWIAAVIAMINYSPPIENWYFWFWIGVVFLFGASYVWLGILAASAKIGFATENHSTRIRWLLILQHCFFLWVAVGISAYELNDGGELWIVLLSFLGAHWGIVGTLMIGERSVLSPRTQRTLPRSFLGRLFRTWLNPGAGPGYIFCVTTFGSSLLVIALTQTLETKLNKPWTVPVATYAAAITAYLALYLGVIRGMTLVLSQRGQSKMLISSILVILALFGGGVLPMMLSYWGSGFYTVTYESYSFTHVPWTLAQIVEMKGTVDGAMIWLLLSAVIVFLCNLLFAYRDVMLIRLETPKKVRDETFDVVEEDAVLIDPLAPDS